MDSGTCIHLIDFSEVSSSACAVGAVDDIDRIFDCDPLEWASSPTGVREREGEREREREREGERERERLLPRPSTCRPCLKRERETK